MTGYPKPVSRARQKAARRASTTAQRRDVYRLVELRDGMKCRACGIRLLKTVELDLKRVEHHHIRGRGGKDSETTANILCLCLGCHQQRHVERSLSITGNADSTVVFERGERQWFG